MQDIAYAMSQALISNQAWQGIQDQIDRIERNPWPSPEVTELFWNQSCVQDNSGLGIGYLLH